MKFECGDLDRALATPELMPEAREHLKQCAACRREYRIWTEISSTAKELHEKWDSPELWPKIRQAIAAEPKRKPAPGFLSTLFRRELVRGERWTKDFRLWAAAALALLGISIAIFRPWEFGRQQTPANAVATPASFTSGDRDFLTDQALKEVETNEAAYRHSIDRLSQLAQPKLNNPASPVAVNCREKLVMLDSAIAETRSHLDENRFNVRLQTELANLYREKQETLKELLTRDQKY